MFPAADEVDALLGSRKAQEHEAVTALKTEFMQLWDGMSTAKNAQVMVLGATNRPFDLDDAILRRCACPFLHHVTLYVIMFMVP